MPASYVMNISTRNHHRLLSQSHKGEFSREMLRHILSLFKSIHSLVRQKEYFPILPAIVWRRCPYHKVLLHVENEAKARRREFEQKRSKLKGKLLRMVSEMSLFPRLKGSLTKQKKFVPSLFRLWQSQQNISGK